MPPKKNTTGGDTTKLLSGFEDKETKLLAAAFLSSLSPDKVSALCPCLVHSTRALLPLESHPRDMLRLAAHTTIRVWKLTASQYDYDLMATLTGNTSGSLKKMWPPIKKKAIDTYPSFAAFLGTPGGTTTTVAGERNTAAPPQAKGSRKRKADTEVEDDAENNPKSGGVKDDSAEEKSNGKPEVKKWAPAAKGKARAPKKVKKEEVKSEEDSADGGDGLGQYTRTRNVLTWLSSTN
jgi:hypothetical protein